MCLTKTKYNYNNQGQQKLATFSLRKLLKASHIPSLSFDIINKKQKI